MRLPKIRDRYISFEKHSKMTDWQQQLKSSITNPEALLSYLQLPAGVFGDIRAANESFKIQVPRAFLDKIEKKNVTDPLLLQVIGQGAELIEHSGYREDPLDEKKYNPTQGLVHKYKTRVLLTLTGGCAVHCRYCFRRHFPYAENAINQQQLEAITRYILADPEINEVILSGGDPLLLDDKKLADLFSHFATLKQLKRIRIHTRFPIVIPDRITNDLVTLLTGTRLTPILVLHSNHPNEIDQVLGDALTPLVDKGVLLLNQTVLLKGVNDCVRILTTLSEKLFDCHVLPYYLHCLDPVKGAGHFELSGVQMATIYQGLQASLPGFLVPKLVREVPGELSKSVIGSGEVDAIMS